MKTVTYQGRARSLLVGGERLYKDQPTKVADDVAELALAHEEDGEKVVNARAKKPAAAEPKPEAPPVPAPPE